jgi:hypothetical protein
VKEGDQQAVSYEDGWLPVSKEAARVDAQEDATNYWERQ